MVGRVPPEGPPRVQPLPGGGEQLQEAALRGRGVSRHAFACKQSPLGRSVPGTCVNCTPSPPERKFRSDGDASSIDIVWPPPHTTRTPRRRSGSPAPPQSVYKPCARRVRNVCETVRSGRETPGPGQGGMMFPGGFHVAYHVVSHAVSHAGVSMRVRCGFHAVSLWFSCGFHVVPMRFAVPMRVSRRGSMRVPMRVSMRAPATV